MQSNIGGFTALACMRDIVATNCPITKQYRQKNYLQLLKEGYPNLYKRLKNAPIKIPRKVSGGITLRYFRAIFTLDFVYY
jgi:hypothetical protein